MTSKWRSHIRLFFGAPVFLALLLFLAPGTFAQDTLDLDKAVKIGTGKTMVIEFTDPDCPFCRKAEAYFQNKAGVTRYIFFIPLASHPASKGKVQYILSAKNKALAYREVLTSSFDKSKLAEITPEGVQLQKEHQEIARANKMTSTPTFMIYGRIIEGFDLRKLEPLLK
jgi:thiol:disulfide interchange protein DsbC